MNLPQLRRFIGLSLLNLPFSCQPDMTRRSPSAQTAQPSIASDQSSANVLPSSPAGGAKEKVLRGKTTCRQLALLPRGTKLPLQFDRKHRPIGKYKAIYTSYQGVIVRNMEITPIDKRSWRGVGVTTKNAMVEAVIEKFEVGDDPARIGVLKKQLGKKWRDYRYRLKKYYYDPYTTDLERIENKPTFVKAEQWEWLVTEYWGTPEVQDTCDDNSERRQCQEMLHRTGSKSFAVVEDEEINMTGDDTIHRIRMFDLAYKGDDERSSIYIKEKQAALNKYREERDEGLNVLTDEEIFDKVFGADKYGRVLCRGFGVTPTMERGSSDKETQNIQESRKEIEDARKEADIANQKCTELTSQLQTTNDALRTMQDQLAQVYQMMGLLYVGGVPINSAAIPVNFAVVPVHSATVSSADGVGCTGI